jgi:hypothetical protein
MYYFCLYKLHGCWKHLVNQEILKVQKPLSIMDLKGTKRTSSNIGVRAELGRFPVENFISCKQFYILPDYILTI